jgi:hypothetical protein
MRLMPDYDAGFKIVAREAGREGVFGEPLTVAASALSGTIADPRDCLQ